jgi:hypothetical protein
VSSPLRNPSAIALSIALTGTLATADIPNARALERDFQRQALPVLKEYCLGCHSTEKHKGDLDLERFGSLTEVVKQPKIWQGVVDQMALGEMPPKEKPQPSKAQAAQLAGWVNRALEAAAQARAGDPGPVVLRRLSNAEYTYTLRDLTGVALLDPAKEFPADSASGEGFMNVGNSLVMSPGLLTKYLDAAKGISEHAVLLPDGIAFSPSTSPADWAGERLTAIRAFYGRFTQNGGGSAVNLQGIKFDTKDGGVLPLAKYLEATLELREAAGESGKRKAESEKAKRLAAMAQKHGLVPKYLNTLWSELNNPAPSFLLDQVRARWRAAKPGEGAAVAEFIAQWQQSLWRFTQVGHIGKRDGPVAWQVPVTPLAEAREVRLKLPASTNGQDVSLFLTAADAGDGNAHDFAVWENPRLVAAGRPDLPLRDVRSAMARLTAGRDTLFRQAAGCLAAAAEVNGALDEAGVARLAGQHGVEPAALAAWLSCLGLGAGEARLEGHMTARLENMANYDFVTGWSAADALSVIANSSAQPVRVPGNLKPHSVATHPAPNRRALLSWRSPVVATVRVQGVVQHAHPECGNGVTWTVELRRGPTRQRLAAGIAQGAKEVKFGPLENLAVQPGDAVTVVIGPRDGNHSCDLTAVDFTLTDGTRTWDLAKDVSPNLLAGNPHADSLGNAGVWHFHSEPDQGGGPDSVLPAGSLLAKWQSAGDPTEKQRLAGEVQRLLTGTAEGLAKDSPDAALRRQLTSLNGPLLSGILRSGRPQEAPVEVGSQKSEAGIDPALFGKHPDGAKVAETSLCVRAPSVIEVRLPAELAEGCEFVATTTLHAETGAEGSVQMQVLTTKPASLGLAAGVAKEQGGKGTWSDGERPVVSDSPILVKNGSAARRRIETALEQFRQLFPAALCYTKIVPVDEVVTLTLYYREDEALRRLMLEPAEVAELERLWAELHFVSQDALKLVDAFEQLWQYATQDADPSAFTPMREPINRRAQEFRRELTNAQPAHLTAVLKFAEGAYRRSLTPAEQDELRGLYRKLRAEELPHEAAVRLTLARTLVAPAFLYRAEKPGPGEQASPVSDWELATRLSYFLWSSAPDAELRAVAASGKLREPKVLAAQTRRLLQDPRARRLATEFACAWLHVYDFNELDEKSERHFPTFNGLRDDMYEETIRFFTDLFRNNGRVLDILDADYAFVNPELAKHYGIPEEVYRAGTAADDGWRRVSHVKSLGRGGVLGQATTLAKQSGASRTSPILRGNWLAETLLGEKLPRPPKDVPRLPEDEATGTLTVRQLTEKHSTDPKCFGCHRQIDPYGYALEGYDAIGRKREVDLGGHPVETQAKVIDGSEFVGLDGLRSYLLTKRRDAFVRQFCRKLLGYSLGRSVQLSDGPLIAELQAKLKKGDFRIAPLVEAIVQSRQFREIRGRDVAAEE